MLTAVSSVGVAVGFHAGRVDVVRSARLVDHVLKYFSRRMPFASSGLGSWAHTHLSIWSSWSGPPFLNVMRMWACG